VVPSSSFSLHERKHGKSRQDAKCGSDLPSESTAGGGLNVIFLPALEAVLGEEIVTMVVKRVREGRIMDR
jgi:hypothetical protein